MQVIEPYLIRTFTADTYSAIPNRGSHKLINKLTKAVNNDTENCMFCLKFDIKHYYQSIDHEILKQKYKRIFKDEQLLNVIFEIIDSINTATEEDIKYIKEQCENIGENIGIPIGNYLSQYSANLYLSEFDHFVKEKLKAKHYYRYMDDIVILGKTKEQLKNYMKQIVLYLNVKLKLVLKQNYQIFPTLVRGVDFVGYRTFYGFVLLRKTTCKNMKKKMNKISEKCKNGNMMSRTDWRTDWNCINSYIGILKHCNGNRLYNKYIKPLEKHYIKYYIINILCGGKTMCRRYC